MKKLIKQIIKKFVQYLIYFTYVIVKSLKMIFGRFKVCAINIFWFECRSYDTKIELSVVSPSLFLFLVLTSFTTEKILTPSALECGNAANFEREILHSTHFCSNFWKTKLKFFKFFTIKIKRQRSPFITAGRTIIYGFIWFTVLANVI